MPAITLEPILQFLQSMLALILGRLGLIDLTGQEIRKTLGLVQSEVVASGSIVSNLMYGNAALLNAINGEAAVIVAQLAAIQEALTDITDGDTPVALPVTPPAGYGGLSASATGDAVWLYATGFPSGNALGALSEIRYSAVLHDVGGSAYPAEETASWWIAGPFYDSRFAPNPPGETFVLDFSTILATDATANDWVRRVYPGANWELPVRGTCVLNGSDNYDHSLPWLTQPVFDAIKIALAPSGAVLAP